MSSTTFQLHGAHVDRAMVRFHRSSSSTLQASQIGPRNSFRLAQSGFMFTHTNPANVSQASYLKAHVFARVALWEVFLVRRKVQRPRRACRPSCGSGRRSASCCPWAHRPAGFRGLLTDVVERFDAAVFLANHQDRLASHLFHLPVAGLRQLRFAAQQQPDPSPHVLAFFSRRTPPTCSDNRESCVRESLAAATRRVLCG